MAQPNKGRTDYTCHYTSNDKNLENLIRSYAELYNKNIDFFTYYHLIWKEALVSHGKCKCRLHDEHEGESFSYKKEAQYWSCFGSCKVHAGGVVEYHLKYLKRTQPYCTIIDAIRDLQRLFPFLPAFRAKTSSSAGKGAVDLYSALQKKIDRHVYAPVKDKEIIIRPRSSLGEDNKQNYDTSVVDKFTLDVYNTFIGDFDRLERTYANLVEDSNNS